MRLLITGASGFIGSYLCNYFHQHDHFVIAATRDLTKVSGRLQPGIIVQKLNVLTEDDYKALDAGSIDAVIHAATANDIVSRNPAEGVLLSVVGTKNILDFCVKQHIHKFIYFSTFQVYGTELSGVIDEQSPPRCKNDYGLNHLFGEFYVEMYAREYDLKGIVVRPSNVYGRFTTTYIDRWTLVPGCFCKEIYTSGIITLQSSGRQTRNFVNLEDVSRAVDCILQTHDGKFDIYNIVSSQYNNMLEVAELVKSIYESRYHKKGLVKVLGTDPVIGNRFEAKMDKIQGIGFTENRGYNLTTEINEIFSHLEQVQPV